MPLQGTNTATGLEIGVTRYGDLTFHPLRASDSDLVAGLEAEIYPDGLRNGAVWFRRVLTYHEMHGWPEAGACSVIRAGGDAIGYLVCVRGLSSVTAGQAVLEVYDLAVRSSYRSIGVMAAASRFILGMAGRVGAPVEASAREGAPIDLIRNQRSSKWLSLLGWHVVFEKRLPKYMGGEDFFFIRIEPLAP